MTLLLCYLLLSLLYLIISLKLSAGLRNVTSSRINLGKGNLTLSLIIAARDEEDTLPALFESLGKQSYSTDLFSITVVNDRSTDGTAEVLEKLQGEYKNLSVITIDEVPKGVAPKKHAIMKGLQHSAGEIVVVTDADCIVPENWLEIIAESFFDREVGLVQGLTGYSSVGKKTLLHRFQSVDFFSHSVVAAAGIGVNLPINSNANNFAYRRKVFDSLEGYGDASSVISGDDDLLLQRVWESGKWKITYLALPEAAVSTRAPESFHEMFEQRKRWGSKTVYYKGKQVAVLSTIFLFYIAGFIQWMLLFTPFRNLALLSITFIVKLIGEYLFFIPATGLFRRKDLLKEIWWASPIQLFVVVSSVLQGVFGSFTWKGDTFRRKI